MGLIASENGGGGDFTPCPDGVHIGVCYAVIDLGHQHGEYKGEPTCRHEVYIGWQIPSEMVEITRDEEKVMVPQTVSAFYTLSINPKANLCKHLDAWRGKKFTEKELEGFDLYTVLGKACQLQVVHMTKADGKVNAKVETVMALPKGVPAPALIGEPVSYSLSDGGDIPDAVKDGLAKMIEKSDEWQAMLAAGGTDDTTTGVDVGDGPPTAAQMAAETDSDLPF